jgi:hypothetical protein
LAFLVVAAAALAGCSGLKDKTDDAKDTVVDTVSSEVKGSVTDNRGQPVEGATVRLYNLLDNTDFVTGGNLGSLEAYIDREAVLSSDNDLRNAVTKADGHFSFKALPSAFLAVATQESCSAGFAGFDEETGILNLDTLIKPTFKNGLSFSIPTFVLACAEPPDVSEDGNSEEAPPFEPDPPPPPSCDTAMCAAAGGSCKDDACVITCVAESCAQSGGTCFAGECVVPPKCDATACAVAGGTCDGDACVTPSCDATACATSRGTCSADGSSCEIPTCFAAEADCKTAGGNCSDDGATCLLPACKVDEDCQAGQLGAWCDHPGDVALAKCEPPAPAEIVPPPPPPPPAPMMEASGWTELRITDSEGNLLADASKQDQRIASKDIPEDGLVRIYGKYSGSADTAFIQVQSGGQICPKFHPRTDFVDVELEDGVLSSEENDYVEFMLHGGCQKLQLSTSNVLGEGERSFVVDIGDRCAQPRHAFIAILTWQAGRRHRADLDLNVWNAKGELVHVGRRQTRWGWLRRHGRGPGPEVFIGDEASEGPFTIKVQFFSGKPREVAGKVRIFRIANGEVRDETFRFTVNRPKDVAEIGVFGVQ